MSIHYLNHTSADMINRPIKAAIPRSVLKKTRRGVHKAGTTLKVKALLRRMDAVASLAQSKHLLYQPGSCQCGCGQQTTICTHNDTKKGYIKGQPYNFLPGHHMRVQKIKAYVATKRNRNGGWK